MASAFLGQAIDFDVCEFVNYNNNVHVLQLQEKLVCTGMPSRKSAAIF